MQKIDLPGHDLDLVLVLGLQVGHRVVPRVDVEQQPLPGLELQRFNL